MSDPVGYQLDIYGGSVEVHAKRRRLARVSDPRTSQDAADKLDLSITKRHEALLNWLRKHDCATDDQLAVAAVKLGLCKRHEQGRRLVRTMREAHHLIVAAVGPDGAQIEAVNYSGRRARCWRVAP